MTNRTSSIAMMALFLAACATTNPSPAPTLSPGTGSSPAASSSTTRPSTTEAPTPTIGVSCALGLLTVGQFLAADATCFVSEDVSVVGWWGARRADEPGQETNLGYLLRGSMPFGAQSEGENVLFVDENDAVGPGGWPDGIHWAVVTGRRSATSDRACHRDPEAGVQAPAHCPSYLIASKVVESDAPASALAACSTLPVEETGWDDVGVMTGYPPACFGSRDVTVRGWFDILYIITGWEAPWSMSPGWLWVPIGPWTVVSQDSNPMSSGALTVYIDPARGLDVRRTNRWVVLTGHYSDAKAATCRIEYAPDFDPGDARIPDAFARRTCEAHFVATSIRDTSP